MIYRMSNWQEGWHVYDPKSGAEIVKAADSPVMLVLRHGQTDYDKTGHSQGWNNEGLDSNGVAEIKKAIAFLRRFQITHLFSSDIGRAVESANMVSGALDVPLTLDQRLRPWDLGILTGRARAENKSQYKFFIDNPSAVIPDGESLDQFHERFDPAFEQYLMDAEQNGLSLILTHASNIILANDLVDGTDMEPEIQEKVRPGGVLSVHLEDDGYRMDAIFREKKLDAKAASAQGY